MKEVDINKNSFWYNGNSVDSLDMANGKHIRFTAVDKSYDLSVINPEKKDSNFNVPDDNKYHKFEIKGKKDQTYTFSIEDEKEGPGDTVPQMIVKVS